MAGSQVTLTRRAGERLPSRATGSAVEAEVVVRYRPAGGTEETERFAGLRLTNDARPGVADRGREPALASWIRLAAGADYDATRLASFPAVDDRRLGRR